MRWRFICALSVFLLMLLPTQAQAQTGSNLRTLYISTATDTVSLDTLSIIPGTLVIQTAKGDTINPDLY